MGTRFHFGVMRIFWSKIVPGVLQHCECTKSPGIIYFKWQILHYLNFTSVKINPVGIHYLI